MPETKDMSRIEALAFAHGIVSQLAEKKIWCAITERNEPDLKFIKIEASIKVK